jgi:hypothetical protein
MNLFDRLPRDLFAPLTGRNNRRAWELLHRLSDRFFGVDSVPPYVEGYLRDQVVKEVERFLLDRGWDAEEGDAAVLTPIVIQANQLLARLVETGWLVQERVGFRQFISMDDTVARFMDTVQQFLVQGPRLVGGDILMIYNQVREAVKDPRAQASGFISAAQLCVGLINSLRTTTARVSDLMKQLTQESDTPIFVKRFFTEHISELYVRDFKQLKTKNHPLRLRFEILQAVNAIAYDDGARRQLLAGYGELPGANGTDVAEQVEADLQRFRRLLDVEKFLDRLDSVVDAATQRAVATLGYRLKASERLVEVLDDTVRAALLTVKSGLPLEGVLFGTPLPIGENRLRLPIAPAPKPVRRALSKREMTPRERALMLLRKAMIENRDVSPKALKAYVAARIPPGGSVNASELPIQTVHDAISYLGLVRLALISTRQPHLLEKNPMLRNLGFRAQLVAGKRAETVFFETSDFTITRE